MSTRLRGEAEFEYDGKTYKLVMDVSALLEAEEATGLGLFEMSGAGIAKLTVLAALLVAAAGQGSGQKLTRAEAAELLLLAPDARDAVVTALLGALPDPVKAGGARPPKAAGKRGTGKTS